MPLKGLPEPIGRPERRRSRLSITARPWSSTRRTPEPSSRSASSRRRRRSRLPAPHDSPAAEDLGEREHDLVAALPERQVERSLPEADQPLLPRVVVAIVRVAREERLTVEKDSDLVAEAEVKAARARVRGIDDEPREDCRPLDALGQRHVFLEENEAGRLGL